MHGILSKPRGSVCPALIKDHEDHNLFKIFHKATIVHLTVESKARQKAKSKAPKKVTKTRACSQRLQSCYEWYLSPSFDSVVIHLPSSTVLLPPTTTTTTCSPVPSGAIRGDLLNPPSSGFCLHVSATVPCGPVPPTFLRRYPSSCSPTVDGDGEPRSTKGGVGDGKAMAAPVEFSLFLALSRRPV
jgi:hypothetical protein